MRRSVSLLQSVAKSLALAALVTCVSSSAAAAPAAPATRDATKTSKPEAAKPHGKGKAKRHHAAKKPVRHHRNAKLAAKPVAAPKAVSVAAAKPTGLAIVDATPLRFAPHTEENAAPEAAKKPDPELAKKAEPLAAKAAEPATKVVEVKEKKDKKGKKAKKEAPKPPCLREAVHFERFEEKQSFSLLTCEGAPAPMAIERLSLMARPGGLALPSEPVEALAKRKGDVLYPGVKRLDIGLLERLQAVVDKLRPKATANLSVISGYRPASKGSLHAEGQAIDFSLAGSSNTELVDACKSLDDTGCGFYPNSSFIHMDVRPKGAGHVSWIDASGPGEEARYVSGWPLSPNDARRAKAAQGIDLQERQGREWHQIPTDERRGVAASTTAPIAMPDEPSDR